MTPNFSLRFEHKPTMSSSLTLLASGKLPSTGLGDAHINKGHLTVALALPPKQQG